VRNGRGAINDEAKQEDVNAILSHVREVTMAIMIDESVFMTVRRGR